MRERLNKEEKEMVDEKLIKQIMLCCEEGVFDALCKGADPNKIERKMTGYPVIVLAILKDSERLVRLLINAGADLERRVEPMRNGVISFDEGKTPLLKAAAHKKANIVKLLLEEGANPDAKDNFGLTALHDAVLNNDMESLKHLELIMPILSFL